MPLLEKLRPGIFYSPVHACATSSGQGRNLITVTTGGSCELVVTAHERVLFDHQQYVVIGLPVALGTPIKGLSVCCQIIYPSGSGAAGRTFITHTSLVEISPRGASSNLLSDTGQLNATQPTTYTTTAGLAANKKVVGPLTCRLQIVIGDPQDVILIKGIKLITG